MADNDMEDTTPETGGQPYELHWMRSARLMSCSDESYVISIKDWLNHALKEQRNKLFLEIGLRDVADYDVASLAVQDGRFSYEPPLPTFRQSPSSAR
jgi:hypothetical protein